MRPGLSGNGGAFGPNCKEGSGFIRSSLQRPTLSAGADLFPALGGKPSLPMTVRSMEWNGKTELPSNSRVIRQRHIVQPQER
jgi:hypothetical protein